MRDYTTTEHLRKRVLPKGGAVLRYGDRVFATVSLASGGFSAEIYRFVGYPKTDEGSFVTLVERSDRVFDDGGHAVEWCLDRCK